MDGAPHRKQATTNFNYIRVLNFDMHRFTAVLKETDADQVFIESERVSFERKKNLEEKRRYDQYQ